MVNWQYLCIWYYEMHMAINSTEKFGGVESADAVGTFFRNEQEALVNRNERAAEAFRRISEVARRRIETKE